MSDADGLHDFHTAHLHMRNSLILIPIPIRLHIPVLRFHRLPIVPTLILNHASNHLNMITLASDQFHKISGNSINLIILHFQTKKNRNINFLKIKKKINKKFKKIEIIKKIEILILKNRNINQINLKNSLNCNSHILLIN